MQSPKMMFMKSPLMAYGNDGIEFKKKYYMVLNLKKLLYNDI